MNKKQPLFIIIPLSLAVVSLFFFQAFFSQEDLSDLVSYVREVEVTTVSSGEYTNSGKRYGIESAKIEYDYGGLQAGSETIYFEDFGLTRLSVVNTTIEDPSGLSWVNNSLRMIKGNEMYVVDLDTYELSEKTLSKDEKLPIEVVLENRGAQKIGRERVLGRESQVWELKGGEESTKWWIWNSILLKSEVQNNNGEAFSISASSIEENISIPQDLLNIPKKADRG